MYINDITLYLDLTYPSLSCNKWKINIQLVIILSTERNIHSFDAFTFAGSALHQVAGYTETTSDKICTQYSTANCEKY